MYIFNQVINFNASPGILGDVTNGNNANLYPLGTIFFETDTKVIARAEGNPGEQTWVTYSGGGGSQTLQQVLDTGNTADDQSINLTEVNFGGASFALTAFDLKFYKDPNNSSYNTLTYETLFFRNPDYDYSFDARGIYYKETSSGNVLRLEFAVFGDKYIQTLINNGETPVGLRLNFTEQEYFLGDFDGVLNNTYINVSDTNGSIILNYNSTLRLQGTNLTEQTAGLPSGNYLIIYCNGTKYKISLLNDTP